MNTDSQKIDASKLEIIRQILAQSPNLFRVCLKGKRSFKNSEKLPLPKVILLIMRGLHRSLQTEIIAWFFTIDQLNILPSASALCQARQKICSSLFRVLSDLLCLMKGSPEPEKLFGGKYILVAVDGFCVYLPQTKALKAKYGTASNQFTRITMAQAVIAYDTSRSLIISSLLAPYKTPERDCAIDMLDELVGTDRILVYDRHYASYEFAHEHNLREAFFVARIRKNWNNEAIEFIASSKKEEVIELTVPCDTLTKMRKKDPTITGKHTLTVRLVKGIDNKGQAVYYVTNLLDSQELNAKQIHNIYTHRWRGETCIDAIKNKLQLEKFSGHKVEIVEQDFYANIANFNLNEIIQCEAEKLIRETKEARKHDCKINHSLAIGIMSIILPHILDPFEKNPERLWYNAVKILARFPQPVRPGRTFLRRKRIRRMRGKYMYWSNYKCPT